MAGDMNNCTHGCVNTEGSYFCTCPAGYELREDNNTCSGELMATCVGVDKIMCILLTLYLKKSWNSHHFFSISIHYSQPDLDECTKGTQDCTDGCVNTEGSYYCTCPGGYELKGDKATCVGELNSSIQYNTIASKL